MALVTTERSTRAALILTQLEECSEDELLEIMAAAADMADPADPCRRLAVEAVRFLLDGI